MIAIQQTVKLELESRLARVGPLIDVRLERPVRGKHRSKNWDVTLDFARRPQLAISTKAIIDNPGGSVPNRVDDAMGECVNIHALDPGMVLGYLFVMDASAAGQVARTRSTWGHILAESLGSFSGRRSERDSSELFEAATLLIVDFAAPLPGIRFHPRLLTWNEFFEVLIGHVRTRQPLIDRGLG